MNALKKLPIGIQNFEEIIRDGYLYVDKTRYVHQLVTQGKLYFLSRPRRFGKSVLLSTIQALFEGKVELFKGLWIEKHGELQTRPVIRLDFLGVESDSRQKLEHDINRRLDEQARRHGLQLTEQGSANRFRELILGLAERDRVVVLIDEYDKPILDHLSNSERAAANKTFLATFYATLKSVEDKLHLLFLTGVSKFTRVSLFSELNNLEDLTLNPDFAVMTGYTDEEIDRYLTPYLTRPINGLTGPDLRAMLKTWYNGYSWDGQTRVYNPVSVLNMIKQRRLAPFWFATGTPRFLIDLIRNNRIQVPGLEQLEIGDLGMEGFEPERIDPLALLFQTGYLTIQEIDWTPLGAVYRLGYPNLEVKHAFLTHVLADISDNKPGRMTVLAGRFGNHLAKGDIDAFCQGLQGMFASIPYNIFLPEQEAYYHTVIYLSLSLIGLNMTCEIQTNDGRIDAVLETESRYYIMEFKVGPAEDAMGQILEKDYAGPYRGRGKTVVLLGVGIDPEAKNIGDWLSEENS